MKVETWPLDRVVPYARNPRKNSGAVAKVAASLKEFGWRQPIVVDGDGVIVVGHTRYLAAQQIGMTEAPVHVATGLTAAQIKAYRIADNRTNEEAEWDMELLSGEMEDLRDFEYDLAMTGFDKDELVELVGAAFSGDITGDEDAVPDAPEEPETIAGEIIVLGRHRLMCGDSTKADDVKRLMDGVTADMVWTDPPYNVAYEGKTEDALTIQNDKMDDGTFRQFLRDAFVAAIGVVKVGGPIYVAHADTEGINFRGAFIEAGWLLKQVLVWAKNTMVLGRQDYQWKHEPILYGWKPGAAHTWHGERDKTTLLEFDKPSRSAEHPTMKPVALVQYCIENSSKPGDTVLDLFGGSGTTLIACEKIGRSAFLMELDPVYCDVIVRRWEEATGQIAKRVKPKATKRKAEAVEVG